MSQKYKYADLDRDYLKQGKPLPDDVNEFFERLAREKFPNHTHLDGMFKEARLAKWIGSFTVLDGIEIKGEIMPITPMILNFRKGVCVDSKMIKHYVRRDDGVVEGYFEASLRSEDVLFEGKKRRKQNEKQNENNGAAVAPVTAPQEGKHGR